MTSLRIEWKQAENALPGIRKLWKAIKTDTGSRVRSPKTVVLQDVPAGMFPNDSSCCCRYAVDLERMQLVGKVHVSAGEWAVHGGDNYDSAVDGVSDGKALVSCEWNDYYRFFSLTIQVAHGAIRALELNS